MSRLIATFIFFIGWFTLANAQNITWIQTNSTLNGNVNDVVHQNGNILAGTIAGVHRTTDLGNSWQLTNSGLNNTKVFAFAVKNENELFCGTQGGIYYSSNKGDSWVEKNNGLPDKFITTLYHKGGDTIYTGTLYSGMFISTNGGNSWDSVAGEFSTKAVNAIAKRYTGEIYVGTTSGLYRSDTKGKNFITMTNNLPEKQNVYSISIRTNGIVFFGTRDGQIWRTTNNGNSWTKQLDLKANIQVYNILFASNGNLFAATYGNGVYRSNDNGETWEQINNGLSNKSVLSLAQHSNGNLFAATWGNGVFKGYEPPVTATASGKYCAGDYIPVQIKVSSGFTFNAGNEFIIQLSDSSGSFTKPVEIGRFQQTGDGTVNCLIPESTKTSKTYTIRVVSTSPVLTGASTEFIEINALPGAKIQGKQRVCINAMEQYYVKTESNVRSEWYVESGTIKSPATLDTIDVEWRYSEDTRIMLVRKNMITGCSDTTYLNIQFWPAPSKPTISRSGDYLVSSAEEGNQWYRDGEIIDGENGKVLELKGVPGIYTVQVTDANGCISQLSDEFDYNVKSVETVSFYYGVNIYPVPAVNSVNAEIFVNVPAIVTLDIYNVQGEKLESRELGIMDGKTVSKIDMDKYIDGTYYLKFNLGSEVIMRKIVIIR